MSLTWLIGIIAFIIGFACAAAIFWRRSSAARDETGNLRIELARSQAVLQAEKDKTAWTEEARRQLSDPQQAPLDPARRGA